MQPCPFSIITAQQHGATAPILVAGLRASGIIISADHYLARRVYTSTSSCLFMAVIQAFNSEEMSLWAAVIQLQANDP